MVGLVPTNSADVVSTNDISECRGTEQNCFTELMINLSTGILSNELPPPKPCTFVLR